MRDDLLLCLLKRRGFVKVESRRMRNLRWTIIEARHECGALAVTTVTDRAMSTSDAVGIVDNAIGCYCVRRAEQ